MITAVVFVALAAAGAVVRAEAGRRWNRDDGMPYGTLAVPDGDLRGGPDRTTDLAHDGSLQWRLARDLRGLTPPGSAVAAAAMARLAAPAPEPTCQGAAMPGHARSGVAPARPSS